MFSRIEKFIYKKELNENKLLVGEVSQDKKSSRIILCLFKGLLIFIASYCSVCSLLDSFNIPYNRPVIFIGFAVFSLYVSMLYLNKVIFYVFYIILFIVFTVELARYYFPANSGFQAATNIIYEAYSDYFNLPSLRESQEIVSNRYYTVTIAALFMGAFSVILLNVTISGYMNAFETMLVTFPFVEIALFIHKIPNPIYMFGLLFVYCSVLFLQLSAHSRMQVKGKHTHEFLRLKTKKQNSYAYQADIPIFIRSFLISAVVSLILVVLLVGPLNIPVPKTPGNPIRKQTEEYVKIFVQNGFSGFLDSYVSTGGLAGGKLGGVSQVRPDFQTDLNVTFVPISYETVYLKGYTGSVYLSSGWYESSENFDDLEDTREYERRAARMKEIFCRHGFNVVYDRDVTQDVGDGFFFTLGYGDLTSEQLLLDLMYYGVSSISLSTTGSLKRGVRACVSRMRDELYDVLDERMAAFDEDHR